MKEHYLYVLDLGTCTKFGITLAFESRMKRYLAEYSNVYCLVRFKMENRRKAELLEKLTINKLKQHVCKGREYVSLPAQVVKETIIQLAKDYYSQR